MIGSTARRTAIGLLAVLAGTVASAHDGRKLFDKRCAGCHDADKLTTAVRDMGTPDVARERLERLLLVHHAPDHDDHAAIIEYLLSLPR